TGLGPAEFAQLLRPLAPRLYSIASSQRAAMDEAHLTVSLVDHESFNAQRRGVVSSLLAGLDAGGATAPIYLHRNAGFRRPPDPRTPIIMVGPGTGVAPFRAFVAEREVTGAAGRNWLFFGDRNFGSDFLYQSEWLDARKRGVLTRIDVAFSRDQADKIYVQDRLRENGAAIWAWLQEGAHFYVCGDAERMAHDVHAALLDIARTHGALTDEAAVDYVTAMQRDSRFLRGTLAASLIDPVTGAVSATDTLLTKFFGIYQQDDREQRDERRRSKLEPKYNFMVRVRLPGGVCTTAPWLALDTLAQRYAGNTLRLTPRQTFQFHHITKRNLRAHIQGICGAGLDTIAACGDVNRNVICTANPLQSAAHAEVSALAARIGAWLLPRTGAYREVFLEAPPGPPSDSEEPIYGSTYLPRKFKIALAIPPQNDIDVFAHDLGFIAIIENGAIAGYNVCVGGGMGMTHKVSATFPRLSDVVGFCTPAEVLEIAEHAMCIQRDYGDRVDRAHARFKYTIEDRGTAWFCDELARRRGRALEAARTFQFESSADRLGWLQGADGRWHYTIFIENGRIEDRA